MTERWTCTHCSAENEPWAVGCSKCGTVRADLSVAGSRPEAAAPEPPPAEATSDARAPQPPDAAPTTLEPSTPSAMPAWTAVAPNSRPEPPAPSAPVKQDSWAAEMPLPPEPAKASLWQRLPWGLIVVGFFVVAGGIGGLIFNASRSSEGEITRGGNLEVADLRVGDCYDLKDPSAEEVGEVTALPCTSEHEYELFFTGTMPEGAYPGDDGFGAWLDQNCVPAFEAFVGKAYDDSELEIFWLSPTTEGWNAGDRSIQCAVYHPTIHRLTESLKGSAR